MRIAIIGAGHLGYIIAEFLSNEQYDVVVVDSDESKLDAIRDALDVLTIHADGTSPSFMRDEDMKGTDIVVAVTAIDEVNIIACILAKKNGIPHTIARIRDPKFLAEPPSYIRENFDIDLLLSPELITAREINRILMTPSALNVEDFAEGKVRLMETKLGPRSPLLHIPLKDLRLPQSVLIAMIFRDHRMIIPHGNDVLLPLDNVYFLGNPETVAELPQNVGAANYQHRIRRALIIGAGRTGQILAPMLEEQGISVKVIDNDRDHCRLVASRLKKGIVLYGDGTDIDLLKQEGVEDADIVICITSDERLNMMDGAPGQAPRRPPDHRPRRPHRVRRPHAAGRRRHRPCDQASGCRRSPLLRTKRFHRTRQPPRRCVRPGCRSHRAGRLSARRTPPDGRRSSEGLPHRHVRP